jgi:hypothetical protein
MAQITVRGQPIEVDIRTELEAFEWTRAKWSAEKLLAASPYRYDNQPSFYVYLEDTASAPAGSWGDSGAFDQEFTKGGFVKLLAFLRQETEEETEDYLLSQYDFTRHTEGLPKLNVPKLGQTVQPRHLDASLLDKYTQDYTYLSRRGINEVVQRTSRICYDKRSQAVVIPWFDASGRLANVKYRKTYGKVFWYEKGAVPIRELVWGIDQVYENKTKSVVLCEAEIDAMTWQTVGLPAIATGGAHFSDNQADVIKRAPIERVLIAADNDKAGAKYLEKVIELLTGFVELVDLRIECDYKDANEAHNGEGLRWGSECIRQIKSGIVDNLSK